MCASMNRTPSAKLYGAMQGLERLELACASWRCSPSLVRLTAESGEARQMVEDFAALARDCSALHREILDVYSSLPSNRASDSARDAIVARNEVAYVALERRSVALVDRARGLTMQ